MLFEHGRMASKEVILSILNPNTRISGFGLPGYESIPGIALSNDPGIAARTGQLQPVELLIERGTVFTGECLDGAALEGHLKILRFFEEKGEVTRRWAMQALYRATNGKSWTKANNWDSEEPEDKWRGVKAKDGWRISLSGFGLAGTLPVGIWALHESLYTLDLAHNALTGALPSSIGYLTALTDLRLNDNAFEGPIPPTIGNLTQLRTLRLDRNEFTGCLPDTFRNLTGLSVLHLGNLQLSAGPIMSIVGSLSEFISLHIDHSAILGHERSDVLNMERVIVVG